MIKCSRSITVSVWRDLVVTVCTVRDMKLVSDLGIFISCFGTVSDLCVFLLQHLQRNMSLLLTHISRMDFPSLINWNSQFLF